ncbi:MAG TPA: chorismate-binding protein [Lactobacillaceae bacterium]|jgi:anthranilate synthase component 1
MQVTKTLPLTLDPIDLMAQLALPQRIYWESLGFNQQPYAIIGLQPAHEIQYKNGQLHIDQHTEKTADPLAKIAALIGQTPQTSAVFNGGALGYVGFDMMGVYENLGAAPLDDLDLPDAHFFVFDDFIRIDLTAKTLTIVVGDTYGTTGEMATRLSLYTQQVLAVVELPAVSLPEQAVTVTSNTTKAAFLARVADLKEQIVAGEFFQAVLSQRFQVKLPLSPLDYFRLLAQESPASYHYLMDFGNYQVLGASPERLVGVVPDDKGFEIITNPIAGTRHRGQTAAQDDALARELQNSEKDNAEHLMLIDLGRNDLGRVSEIGSVQVTADRVLQRYANVMHLVSEVSGRLAPEFGPMDALRVTLPAGTVSGAPKIRAVSHLYRLETTKRGVYAGAIGAISRGGLLDMAIAIRTMVAKNKQGYVQAGAGIVYDSDPASEYQETLHKAGSLLRVLGDVEVVE